MDEPESYRYETNLIKYIDEVRAGTPHADAPTKVTVINAACIVAKALMVVAAAIRDQTTVTHGA